MTCGACESTGTSRSVVSVPGATLISRGRLSSALIAADEDGSRLDDDELIAMCVLLLFAGHETTTHLIGNGILALIEWPNEFDRLRAEPGLLQTSCRRISTVRFASTVHRQTSHGRHGDQGLCDTRWRVPDTSDWRGQPRSQRVRSPRSAGYQPSRQPPPGVRSGPAFLPGCAPGAAPRSAGDRHHWEYVQTPRTGWPDDPSAQFLYARP